MVAAEMSDDAVLAFTSGSSVLAQPVRLNGGGG